MESSVIHFICLNGMFVNELNPWTLLSSHIETTNSNTNELLRAPHVDKTHAPDLDDRPMKLEYKIIKPQQRRVTSANKLCKDSYKIIVYTYMHNRICLRTFTCMVNQIRPMEIILRMYLYIDQFYFLSV